MAIMTKMPMTAQISQVIRKPLKNRNRAPNIKAKIIERKIIHLAACQSVSTPAEISPKNAILLIILGESGKQMFKVYGLES